MTARLHQDALERFFGMMRGACGSNDHPDPQLFAQVFRLLCSYSLIKPAKGSNVSGTELLKVLMQTEDSLAMSKKPRSEWLNRIYRLLEDSDTGDCDRKSHEQDHNYEASATMTCSEWNESVHDHTYDVARTSPQVQAYIAGYVVRRMRRRLKCDDCINALQSHDNEPGDSNHKMIDMMNQYGGLIHPSDALFYLTETLESIVLDVVGKFGVKIDTFQTIIEKLSELKDLPAIGCVDHHKETTRKIIDFYMIMRGHFLTESFNKNNNGSRQRTKKLRKNAKL